MIGEVFNLTAKIVRLSKVDQKRVPAALKPTRRIGWANFTDELG